MTSRRGTATHKAYNKDNIAPEKRKTFNDVKGCDEAKMELQEIVQYFTNSER
eukprot:CAMPEP_0197852384 /NCGR_PEP_ID=MMETSP1438-20131217/20460_1 /TAXON_ID=1461541 /ORGANISM="Pterosperma sp., Strain CCMP1384" /LENGTH=51 /DNA_ID=CAMNT_0043466417 /DNA_START=52 /DNA_END=204 /DNA_ORIENTATION=-